MDSEMLVRMIDDLSSLSRDRDVCMERNIAERLEQSLATYQAELNESYHWEAKRIKRKVGGYH